MFLSENTGNHSSQDVTRAPSRHTRIAGWVDVNGSVRRRNDRPISLEHNVRIPLFRELLRDFHAVRHDILDAFSDEARHLAGMRREHSPAEIAFKTSQSIQAICIDDHLRAALRTDTPHEGTGLRNRRQPRANRHDGFVLQQCRDRLICNRPFGGFGKGHCH